MTSPQLFWDWGTGYDLFVSLHVLHNADTFGLRSSWAAGVRSRLSESHREILENAQDVVSLPLSWIYSLPQPKDAATILGALSQIPPRQRLITLARGTNSPHEALLVLDNVADRGSWTAGDLDQLKEAYRDSEHIPKKKTLESMLERWSKPGLFGEGFSQALQAYHHAFFAEEEERIRPHLKAAVREAQEKADRYSFDRLIESLSRGLRFGMELDIDRLTLIPSYWITPLIVYREMSNRQGLFLYGGRPDEESLVPGDPVPETMLRTLKMLADPTRLRILRYLSRKTMAPSELARRLRLRASTVTHHLNALRLAGLVYLTLEEKNHKRYATREEAIAKTFSTLQAFMGVNIEDEDNPHAQ